MLYITGIALAFFLDLLLLSKKGKSKADFILSCWLFVIGIHLLLFYWNCIRTNYTYAATLGFEGPMPLLHGPFLYLYTAAATNRLSFRNKKWLLHFLPAIITYAYMIHFFMLPGEQKIYVFQNKGIGYELFNIIHFYAIIVSGVVYTIWSILLLKKHKQTILDQFSYTENIDLNWLRYLIYGIGGIWLVVIFSGSDNMIFSAVVIFVFLFGYFGIKQGNIFTNVSQNENPSSESKDVEQQEMQTDDFVLMPEKSIRNAEPDLSKASIEKDISVKKKYLKSKLTPEASEAIHIKLLEIMDSEKPYTDGELSLASLAQRLEIHPNTLSQVINETEGKNFYDFINSKRIEAFVNMAEKPGSQKYTLLALAFECGFNSKTSFNRQFKKILGISPSEFMLQRNLPGAG